MEKLRELYLIFAFLMARIDAEKEKRQIFREQVLPASGGKIPEEAFRSDRLALNRLNKEGIAIPDGVNPETHHLNFKHQYHGRSSNEDVLRILLPSSEGKNHYDQPQIVETTYVIRRPISFFNEYNSIACIFCLIKEPLACVDYQHIDSSIINPPDDSSEHNHYFPWISYWSNNFRSLNY